MREPTIPSPGAPLSPAAAVRAWSTGGLLLIVTAAMASWLSPRFGYDHQVIGMPALGLAGGLSAAGLAYALGVPWLLRRTANVADSAGTSQRTLLWIVIATGLAARLILIPSEPMLEDDYQRYLWDGGVTAAGLNPFAISPKQAGEAGTMTRIGALAKRSGDIIDRIGHPGLKTIYPPVAQAAFALAHIVEPWSLIAWKSMVLVLDIAVLALVLALLTEVGRAPLWATLYWWNPLVLKELSNSGHMEPVLMAPLLLALLLAIKRRPTAAVAALAIAAGAKVWPVLLLPLLVRPLQREPRRLIAALGMFAALTALWVWPILSGGLDPSSGFVAYAANWRTNSALFPTLERAVAWIGAVLHAPQEWAARATRALLALCVGSVALWLARAPAADGGDLMRRAGAIAAVLVLLSPAQYPWYAIWFLPFLPFLPLRCFLVLTVTLPVYYAFFHFNARGHPDIFRNGLVWVIWLPAWIALWMDLRVWFPRPGVARMSALT